MEQNTLPTTPFLPSATPVGNAAALNELAAGTPTQANTAAELLQLVMQPSDLAAAARPATSWFWHGYLARGKVTLLTSQWKSGKTTLASVLLSRLQTGGRLAGLQVAPAKVLVVSEESPEDWDGRCQRLGIVQNISFLCRPFAARPTTEQWLALIEAIAGIRARQGTDLVLIDSLAAFLPTSNENIAGLMLDCLMPLQRLTAAGMGVFLVHHPAKGKLLAGQAARGSGALSSFVDIILEMSWFTRATGQDRRRRLRAYSRQTDTPRHLVVELTAEANDYIAHTQVDEEDFDDDWQGALAVLQGTFSKLTRAEILAHWPDDWTKPDPTTLWRWLTRAVAQGIVRQEGSGRPSDPFRYWLPEREDLLHPGKDASPEALQAWKDRYQKNVYEMLGWNDEATEPPSGPTASP